MLNFGVIFVCIALCHGHAILLAVLPVPAAHSVHVAPAPYPVHSGFGGYGLAGYGIGAPLGHHLHKRSPHLVESLAHIAPISHVAPIAHSAPIAHVATIAHVAPVAVSHQARVDVRSSPAIIAAHIVPVLKPALTSFVPAATHLHKSYAAHYGDGHYGSVHPHPDHY